MRIVKVISSRMDEFNKRLVKSLIAGRSDVREPVEAAPFGIDSNPLKDMVAVYSETAHNSVNVIVGYIHKKHVAEPGETRLFSLDSNGALKAYVYLKKDGVIEVGGNDDHMVRFSKLKEVVEELQDDITSLKNVIATWTPVLSDGGTALKTAAVTWYSTPLIKDIDAAKINDIKTR